METSDDGSSPWATISNTDGSSPCRHHHHGPGVTCLGEPIRNSSAVSKTGDNQGVGPNASDDVTITSRAYSPHVDSGMSCPQGSKVSLHHSMEEGLCGGGATRNTDPHLCVPAPSSPSQVKVNPVTSASDGSDDDTFVTAVPASRNTFKSSIRQSAPGDLVQDQSSESELQSRRPGIIEYFSR